MGNKNISFFLLGGLKSFGTWSCVMFIAKFWSHIVVYIWLIVFNENFWPVLKKTKKVNRNATHPIFCNIKIICKLLFHTLIFQCIIILLLYNNFLPFLIWNKPLNRLMVQIKPIEGLGLGLRNRFVMVDGWCAIIFFYFLNPFCTILITDWS